MKASISKYTLFEYLAGRLNPIEKQRVVEWLLEEENHETFYDWLLEYEIQHPQFEPDQKRAIENLLERVQGTEQSNLDVVERSGIAPQFQERYSLQRILFVAASVLLVVCGGWWSQDVILYKTYKTDFGQVTDIYLEDGSKVALNANSSLKIPRFGFRDEVREVFLTGEGEFTVSHTTDNKRFVVKTSEAFQVEVLGTQFSVFARPRATKVALTSGSVRIDYANESLTREVMMKPGDLAVLDKGGEVKVAANQDTKAVVAWKEHRFVFDDTSVTDIAAMVEENFGMKVVIANEEIGLRTVSGDFKTQSAEELLKIICEVLDIEMVTKGKSVVISVN